MPPLITEGLNAGMWASAPAFPATSLATREEYQAMTTEEIATAARLQQASCMPQGRIMVDTLADLLEVIAEINARWQRRTP